MAGRKEQSGTKDDGRHPGGRPSKLTPETLDRLRYALRLGASYEHAVAYAGIDRSTFYRWKALGEAAPDGDEERAEYAEFRDLLKSAEGEGAIAMLETLERATEPEAKMAWQSAAWRLERRWPEMYGRRDKVDVEHGGAVKVSATADITSALAAQAAKVDLPE